MTAVDRAPAFTLDDARRIAAEAFDITAEPTPLPSERDQNFRLRTARGERFVLKIAHADEDRAFLDAQTQMLARAAGLGLCPQVVGQAQVDGHAVRVVTYLEGTPLAAQARRTDALWTDLGGALARLDTALEGYGHPSLHRDFVWDLAQAPAVVARYGDGAMQALAERLEQSLAPRRPNLRRSAIHNDANDHNVLVGDADGGLYGRGQRVVGLIDFGDAIFSHTVNELAIAAAYALLDAPDPIAVLGALARGYHALRPLDGDAIAALFPLALLRLCASASLADAQSRLQPDNDYLLVSQAPLRRTLPALAQIPERLVEAAVRQACGLPVVDAAPRVAAWLARQSPAPALATTPSVHVSLAVDSPLVALDDPGGLDARLDELLSGAVGAGGYGEARLVYDVPAFDAGVERRTVHLGVDLFAPAGTPLFAPLDGVVHAQNDNAAPLDYGPVLILAHTTDDGDPLYSIWGHLSRETLARWSPGQRVAKGERLGEIGSADVNGGWPPHLHLQLALDLLGLGCDFPGVGRPGQRGLWTALCPDPDALLRLPDACRPAPPPDPVQTLAHRRQRLGRNLSVAYRSPVKVVRGWKQRLYDSDGRRYVDAYNNVAHVGHGHPRVVAAARRQMGVLNTNTRYLHDTVLEFADALTARLPRPLEVCYFVSSGSEANELALRLARAATGARDTIVLEAAYHGNTTGLIDISPYKHDGPGGSGAPEWVHKVPIPDVYRGEFRGPDAGARYAQTVGEAISRLTRPLCAYIAESLPSVGGQIVLPDGYLDGVYRRVRAAGGVCIADEVQTGFGRIGARFWGFELQGVVPDIVVLGKPIGNGHPLAAVITTAAIADAFDNGMEYFSTFGGNPVSCAIGREVLAVVEDEGLQAHAARVGERLLSGLRPLVDRFPIVGDVRGMGLFLGVELVRDRETLAPAAEEASYVANRLREEGILLGTDGPFHNVVKIRPPMPFDAADADLLIERLDRVLTELT